MIRNVLINSNVVDTFIIGDTFSDGNKFFTRNEKLQISFRAYISVKGSVDFRNICTHSKWAILKYF